MKDKFEELKPEAFKFQKNEEDFTPGLFIGVMICVISAIIVISGVLLLVMAIVRSQMGMWKSRYGNAFVSFPSVLEEDKLEYEVLQLEKEK